MKIRTKIILSLCATAIIIILGYAFFLGVKKERNAFLMESYRHGLESVAGNALLTERIYLKTIAEDYASRDEMIFFTRTRENSWAKSNIRVLTSLHTLSQTLVFNRNKTLIYHATPENKKKEPLFLFNDSVFSFFSSSHSGLFFHKQGLNIYEIAYSAICDPADTLAITPVSGYFVICRAMDNNRLHHLGEITGSKTTLITHPEIRPEKAGDGEFIALIPLPGWNNHPIGYLKFQQYQPGALSYLKITNAIGIFYFLLALFLLVFISLVFFGWLNHPLKKITESLALEHSDPIKTLALKKNEFGEIALMIDRFFKQKKELAAIIHEKNEALSALSDAESKNRIILSAIPDHLFRINIFGVITDFHINAPDEFIPETYSIIGKNFEEIVPPYIVPMLKGSMQAVCEKKQPQYFDFSLDRKNHQIKYYEIILRMTLQGDYLVVVRDISTRKDAEMALYRMVEKEADLNRLKTQFITTVSHEFRTPLSAISSNIQLIELYDEKWPVEKKVTVFGRIQEAVAQMTTLLDDLSVVARDESGKFKLSLTEFNLESFCREIAKEATALFGPDHSVLLNYQCKERLASMDKQLLRHILSNLLTNALKFSQSVTPVLFNVEDSGNNLISFSIKDQGIGISEEDLANIYEPFHRGNNVTEYPGTGLGLSIVKRCVDQHKGSITILSNLGSGTTATVLLPGQYCKT